MPPSVQLHWTAAPQLVLHHHWWWSLSQGMMWPSWQVLLVGSPVLW
jgi:hypothetical protein